VALLFFICIFSILNITTETKQTFWGSGIDPKAIDFYLEDEKATSKRSLSLAFYRVSCFNAFFFFSFKNSLLFKSCPTVRSFFAFIMSYSCARKQGNGLTFVLAVHPH
jgi:hypothetical protein